MIHMQASFDKIKYLVGDENILKNTPDTPVLQVFSDITINFFSDLSKSILSDSTIRDYKDVIGFGYWIRKASLKSYVNNISRSGNKIGRGLCLHIAPSNIPVQFAVSLVPALLAGNPSIVRCSSKQFRQTDIICSKIIELLNGDYQELKPYICIIKYEHNDEITNWLCSMCDVRIIWGGDRTITTLKKFEVMPRTIDICFSDRFSIAIINGDKLDETNVKNVVDEFWIDTYYVDQNACSSPRLIFWYGNNAETSRELFWNKLEEKVKSCYHLEPIQASNKLTSFCRLAMRSDTVKLISNNSYVFRVEVEDMTSDFIDYKDSGGYFFEHMCQDLNEILPIIKRKSCQTIGVFGFKTDDIKKIVFDAGVKGVDRIVNIGNTTAPGLDWDGYGLIDSMSRFVEVE